MKKIMCVIFVVLLFSTCIFTNTGGSIDLKKNSNQQDYAIYQINGDELDQVNGGGNPTYNFAGVIPPASTVQSFKPTLNTLTRVELLCKMGANVSGELIISIRDTILGSDLTFVSVPISSLPTDHFGNWMEFDFPNISVIPEKDYYIVWRQTSEEFGPGWGYVPENYSRGEAWQTINDSVFNFSYDFVFRTYGYLGDNPEISIFEIKGGFGLSAIIANYGASSAENVNWSIDVEVDLGLILSGDHTEDVIVELGAGETMIIRSSGLRGIGSISITVQVEDVSKQATAFLLGPLVLRVREV